MHQVTNYLNTFISFGPHQLEHVPVDLDVGELPTSFLGLAGVVKHDVQLETIL